MREIKYRQPIYINGKFDRWHYWGFFPDAFHAPYMEKKSYEKSQQYTDLKDKNGKEIYEEDVVLVKDEFTEPILDDGSGPKETFNHLCPIVFHNGAFGFDILESGDFYKEQFYSFSMMYYEMGEAEEIEIIGNIYENPELLKDKP